jgi:hypothetical protein
VAAALCLLRFYLIPHQATALWHHTREFRCPRLPSDGGKRDTIESLNLNRVRRHKVLRTPDDARLPSC